MIGTYIGFVIGDVPLTGPITLSITAGSYTLTGQAALFNAAEPVTTGSYVLTGQGALFNVDALETRGIYSLTGQAAGLLVREPCVTGSYVVTGNALVFAVTMSMAASISSTGYVGGIGGFIGAPIGGTMVSAETVAAAAGVYNLVGQSANFVADEPIATGSYALTGVAAHFTLTWSLGAGSYALTGSPAFYFETLRGAQGSVRRRVTRGARKPLALLPRKVTVTDRDGKTRRVGYLTRFAPPPPLADVPAWALPPAPPEGEVPASPAALPLLPPEFTRPAPPPKLVALRDLQDESDLLDVLTRQSNPLVEDIIAVLSVLQAAGALDQPTGLRHG